MLRNALCMAMALFLYCLAQGEETNASPQTQEKLALPRNIYLDRLITNPDPIPEKPVEVQFDFVLKTKVEKLDTSKLKVQIFVYEKSDKGEFTRAKIETKFLNINPRFFPDTSETLRVRYLSKMQNAEDTQAYYGYIFRLIYDGEVQEEKASSPDLLEKFPYTQPFIRK